MLRTLVACSSLFWLMSSALQAATPPQVTDPRLKIELFAEAPQIVTPIGIAVDAQGRVLAIESHTHFRPPGYQGPATDRIRMFEDPKGTGRADRITTFFEGTHATMSLAIARDGSVYVATRNKLFRLRDTKGAGVGDERTPLVHLETTDVYPHNALSGIAFDFHGDVYFAMGENHAAPYKLIGSDGRTFAGAEGGYIFRCRPDGSQLERVAQGFWNPFQICFDTYGRLFAVDNDPDSRPPCRLLHVVPGGDYGFRFRYGRSGLHPFIAWNGELPGTLPMASATGEAPAGLLAYESDNLPAEYRGNLLATSWGDHRIDRFTLSEHGATVWAKMTPLVTGGDDFRPVSMAVAPDGSLYVTDWVDKSYSVHGKGRIWHIRAVDAQKLDRPSDPRAAIHSPHRELREKVARRLAADVAGGRPLLREIVSHDVDPRTRAAALAALANAGDAGIDYQTVALADPSPEVRALAVRSMPDASFDPLKFTGDTQPPAVRAAALRRAATPSIRDVALRTLDDPDPFLQQAARTALGRIGAELTSIDPAKLPTPRERLGLLLTLRAAAESAGRKWLPQFLADPDPAIRFAAIQWVGEERVADLRGRIVALLDGEANTRQLFEACVATLELLDGTQRPDQFHGEQYVIRVLTDPHAADAMRQLALRMLPPAHAALTIERLKQFLNSSDQRLKLEAIRTLRESPRPERIGVLAEVARDPHIPDQLRAEAIVGLSDVESQRELLLTLTTAEEPAAVRQESLRSLRGAALTATQRAQLKAWSPPDQATADLIARILAPPAAANPPNHNVDAWLGKLEGPGDPAAGARIFFHPKAAGCYHCHQIQGRGGHVGPDLSTAARLLGRRKLIESIVDPSKEIAPQFVPWLLVTKDGRTLTGLLLTEGKGGSETYADPTGRLFTLMPEAIAERHPLRTSLMPEGLADQLTLQEFRDLVALLMKEEDVSASQK